VLALSWIGLSVSDAFAAPAAPASPAMSHWRTATDAFQRVGMWIGQQQFNEAKNELGSAVTSLPAPYNRMASDFAGELDEALKLQDAKRLHALVELCERMRAHAAILQLKAKDEPDHSDDPIYAWSLLESGNTKAALAEYQSKLSKEIIDTWQDYYREQIRLIEQRPANLTNADFSIAMVRNRYLKSLETGADLFGALAELTRVLPHAKTPKEAVPVYQLILKCLAGLGDDQGRDAWQQQLLAKYGSDPEVAAGVYVDQARKAYRDKNLKASQELFQKVCTQHSETSAYGDALYGLGLVLQEQQKCDDAIAEYSKLFPSKVNDYAIDSEKSEDYANFRFKAALRISECYETKKDFVRALEYAKLANERYKFVSYCKDCQKDTRENVEKRVQRLQQAARKVE
jgi:tetratricopeptide (TPR) repeat protein